MCNYHEVMGEFNEFGSIALQDSDAAINYLHNRLVSRRVISQHLNSDAKFLCCTIQSHLRQSQLGNNLRPIFFTD